MTLNINDYLAGKIPENGKLICPFHDDRRPSAKVLPGSGRFWCHVCGFAEDRRGIAMRLLFPKTFHLHRGEEISIAVDWLHQFAMAPEMSFARTVAEGALDPEIYRVMTIFCEEANALLKTDVGAVAELIRSRGIKNPITLGFGVGHWQLLDRVEERMAAILPDWQTRREELLTRAGLLSSKGTYGLANRFILPEWRRLANDSSIGEQGTRIVVFYQARSRDDTSKLKYLSPEVPKQFWGLESLQRDTGLVFVSEGVFDVAPLIEAGESAIAIMGLHLSIGERLEPLAEAIGDRLVVICFDNDKPKKDEPIGIGAAQALAMHAKLTGVGVSAVIVQPPDPYQDLGEWLTHVPAARVAAAIKLSH